jgi:S1-C subfamily serine protease
MSIEVVCEACDSDFAVPESLAGKTIKCKSCGEGIPVPAGIVKKASPAKPAAPAKRSRDEDEEDELPRAKSARRVRDEDDEADDTPRRKPATAKKSSKLPIILAGVFGLLIVVGAGVGLMFSGLLDGDKGKGGDQVNTGGPAWTPPDMSQKQPGRGDTAPETPSKEESTKPEEEPKTKPKSENTKPETITSTPGSSGEPRKTLVPVAPEIKKPNPSTNQSNQPRIGPDPLAVTRAKNAAVYIECESNTGAASGSGWFGMEENLIFTNAHVVDMKTANAPKPKKLTVYVNPGTNLERIIPHAKLEIIAVDRIADLAMIRVLNEKDLPSPLKIRPSMELRDVEPLIVIGYPGGRKLSDGSKSRRAPQVTVNTTSFSTNRLDDDGNIFSVQIRGGAAPGNSGGPIIDHDGNVVAVLVRGPYGNDPILAASVNYGVPTEFVSGLMAGRVGDIEFGQAYRKNGKIHIPVKAAVLDPFQRLKEINVACWVGEPGKYRAPSKDTPSLEPSDADLTEVKLNYKWSKEKPMATGELVLPELQAGRAYWARPNITNAIVSKYWMAGKPITLSGPPVDLEDATLIARLKLGSKRPITLSNITDYDEFEIGEGRDIDHRILYQSEIKGVEHVEKVSDPDAIARLRVQYEKWNYKVQFGAEKEDLKKSLPKDLLAIMDASIKLVQGFGYVAKSGEIYKVLSDLRGAGQYADFFKRFSTEAMETLQNTSIKLPNTTVQPGFKWSDTKNHRFQMNYVTAETPKEGGGSSPGMANQPPRGQRVIRSTEYKFSENVTYTYLGTRTRVGSKEAVILIEGAIKPAVGTSSGATGTVKGYAYVDLNTGAIIEMDYTKEFEMDSSREGVKMYISGVNIYKVTRGSAQ